MSNTGSLRRTERAPLSAAFTRDGVATAIAALLFTVILVSFRPFQPAGAEMTGDGGDIVNQLGFGSLGAISIFSLLAFADPRVVRSLLSPSWLLMLGFFVLSVVMATDPPSAMRAASFTLIGILTMATILALPRDAEAFSKVIIFTIVVVIGLSYIGLIVFPHEALHTTDSLEPEHAGLWRGVFTHKNIAGPVMACFSFAGLYLYRRGQRLWGASIFCAAMIFMLHTGSKTTAGLVPFSILIVVLPSLIGMRLGTPILFVLAIIAAAIGTLGIVFLPPVKHLAALYFPDLTYTGRTTLWEFAGEMLAKRPWTGYGFESFWGTPLLLNQDQPFDRAWDIRTIVHGHNGYLDIAVLMGIPALGVAAYTFLIAPLRDYLRIPLRKENIYLGDFFMMVVLFAALNAFLESFFFHRADPVWLFFVFGMFGLRQVSLRPMAVRGPC
ncbi:O-antigen ligase [Mesorhizobium sp.]|uniref:O-antigen ligase family protein n=2 Tax=unclassified Mesorhizobium TaxID=325217 RepID=UPI000FD5421E|nr:O-antigen ligase [Mesorhizobium sp.]RUV77627.1 O-antigen ligase family protein [Mesorhizobium sp. M5C.F.Ca.IN.020.14.1.1]RWG46130.1 MAG: O-antigen ligase family protein [Mesorhizobium sp.]RWH48917.1 MAG: O-antigen ligase family protein [Mesorhizobium sp.]RWH60257.1 MAG: O-antigen ligase family protein [Mesorhizobium sp.]RWI77187.1 MAG: O-antigen ligase family protein [Mesorhizobium sp.]